MITPLTIICNKHIIKNIDKYKILITDGNYIVWYKVASPKRYRLLDKSNIGKPLIEVYPQLLGLYISMYSYIRINGQITLKLIPCLK